MNINFCAEVFVLKGPGNKFYQEKSQKFRNSFNQNFNRASVIEFFRSPEAILGFVWIDINEKERVLAFFC